MRVRIQPVSRLRGGGEVEWVPAADALVLDLDSNEVVSSGSVLEREISSLSNGRQDVVSSGSWDLVLDNENQLFRLDGGLFGEGAERALVCLLDGSSNIVWGGFVESMELLHSEAQARLKVVEYGDALKSSQITGSGIEPATASSNVGALLRQAYGSALVENAALTTANGWAVYAPEKQIAVSKYLGDYIRLRGYALLMKTTATSAQIELVRIAARHNVSVGGVFATVTDSNALGGTTEIEQSEIMNTAEIRYSADNKEARMLGSTLATSGESISRSRYGEKSQQFRLPCATLESADYIFRNEVFPQTATPRTEVRVECDLDALGAVRLLDLVDVRLLGAAMTNLSITGQFYVVGHGVNPEKNSVSLRLRRVSEHDKDWGGVG